ncbi:hypothetical protein OAT67_07935 [Bacteriovoracaceae bacterium]|nr:hypothetical protein [Bacteriovoracaceae bacterium]
MKLLNSGTGNIKYTVSETKFNDIKYENKSRIGNVSFSIRNVQHPKTYGKWNMNLKISPSLHADDTTYQTAHTYINTSGALATLPDINVKRLMMLANLKLTTHTPIGAFALSGGFGGGVIKTKDGQALDSVTTREVRRIDLAYYTFFTDRFFLLMGPRYYREASESFVFAFRLGYFWGSK